MTTARKLKGAHCLGAVTAQGEMVYDKTGGYLCKCTSFANADTVARMLNAHEPMLAALKAVSLWAADSGPLAGKSPEEVAMYAAGVALEAQR